MKKIMALALALVLAMGMVSCVAEEAVGGWQVEDGWCTAAELTEDDKAVFDQAMQGLVGVSYELLALMGTQVVAGTNYCFLTLATTVTAEPASYYALVYVYQDLNGACSVLDIQPLTIGAN